MEIVLRHVIDVFFSGKRFRFSVMSSYRKNFLSTPRGSDVCAKLTQEFVSLLDSTLQGREARSGGTASSLASLSLVFHSTRDPTPDHVSPASDRSDGC